MTTKLESLVPRGTIAHHMEFYRERPQHLPSLIREALLRGIPFSELCRRAALWYPGTEDGLKACLILLDGSRSMTEAHVVLGTLFVKAMVHPAVVDLALSMQAERTQDNYAVCPHPVCRRYDSAPREGLERWKNHFPEHYRFLGGPDSEFQYCWAVFCLSDVLGQEASICSRYLPYRPFRSATLPELEALSTTFPRCATFGRGLLFASVQAFQEGRRRIEPDVRCHVVNNNIVAIR